jgi:hypothetical protein
MYQGRMWIMEVRIHTRTSGDYPSKSVCRSEALIGPFEISCTRAHCEDLALFRT